MLRYVTDQTSRGRFRWTAVCRRLHRRRTSSGPRGSEVDRERTGRSSARAAAAVAVADDDDADAEQEEPSSSSPPPLMLMLLLRRQLLSCCCRRRRRLSDCRQRCCCCCCSCCFVLPPTIVGRSDDRRPSRRIHRHPLLRLLLRSSRQFLFLCQIENEANSNGVDYRYLSNESVVLEYRRWIDRNLCWRFRTGFELHRPQTHLGYNDARLLQCFRISRTYLWTV